MIHSQHPTCALISNWYCISCYITFFMKQPNALFCFFNVQRGKKWFKKSDTIFRSMKFWTSETVHCLFKCWRKNRLPQQCPLKSIQQDTLLRIMPKYVKKKCICLLFFQMPILLVYLQQSDAAAICSPVLPDKSSHY